MMVHWFKVKNALLILILGVVVATSTLVVASMSDTSVSVNSPLKTKKYLKFGMQSIQQQDGGNMSIAFVISAWQYYSRAIIDEINQSLQKLLNSYDNVNVTLIIIDGATPREVLNNLLKETESLIQRNEYDDVIFFVSPWEDGRVRFVLSSLKDAGKLDEKIIFFDAMRPENTVRYLSYIGFADEEIAFMGGVLSSFVSEIAFSEEIDEIAFYTTLPDLGNPLPELGNRVEWHDFTTDVSVTGFFQGVIYYEQHLDVISLPIFDDLDAIGASDTIDQVASRMSEKISSGKLPVVALRTRYNLTSEMASRLTNASVGRLIVLDRDVPLSNAVPFSIIKNHTFLLEKTVENIINGYFPKIVRYSYLDGSYSINYVKGNLPSGLVRVIETVARDFASGSLIIPKYITTATIQPLSTMFVIFALISIPVAVIWRRRRKQHR